MATPESMEDYQTDPGSSDNEAEMNIEKSYQTDPEESGSSSDDEVDSDKEVTTDVVDSDKEVTTKDTAGAAVADVPTAIKVARAAKHAGTDLVVPIPYLGKPFVTKSLVNIYY